MKYYLIGFVIIVIVLLFVFIKSSHDFSGSVGNNILLKTTGKNYLWNPYHSKTSENYSKLWKRKKDTVKNKLQYLTPNESYNKTAVVHFRCSDVPFCKHPEYPLLPKEYYKFVADEIMKRDVENIVIITCNTHNQHPLAYKCSDYSSTIKGWLESYTNLEVSIDDSCQGIKETYEIFLGSKVLISSGGSFSFIPGITKDKDFISPSLFGENPSKGFEDLHNMVHWTMWDKFDKISHNVDYETYIYE